MNAIHFFAHTPSVLLGMCGVYAFVLTGCQRAPEAPVEVVRPAKLYTITEDTRPRVREFPGIVRAFDEVQLSFTVPGRILSLHVREGQHIEEGAIIGRLDARDYTNAVIAARAQLTLQHTQYESVSNLFAQGVVSKNDYDQKARDLEVAQSHYDDAVKNLDDTVLRAPYTGRIARRLAEVGQNVQGKQPIVLLQDTEMLKVTIDVPERVVAVQSPEELAHLMDRVTAHASFPALPERAFPLEIHEYATVADPDTRTYPATFTFPRPDDVSIMPGMSANVTVESHILRADTTALAIPLTAVYNPPAGGTGVWRVDTENMTVHYRDVTLGGLHGAYVEAHSGLSVGDTIVAAGASLLQEGQRIRQYSGPTE